MNYLIWPMLAFWCVVSASAADLPANRLLLIGIDGCRPDALARANTPHLDGLIRNGAFTSQTRILGQRYQENNTVSGPGWSSFLTGVWADKHGVHGNGFEGRNYKEYPHLFRRIKDRWPAARTGSFVDWGPIDQYIVEAADKRVVYPAEGVEDYSQKDLLLAREATEFLSEDDPHAIMLYFGAVDETGHTFGFHPDVAEYVAAIETVDEKVGEVITAMTHRPEYIQENWLVIVSTDHGGQGTHHGDGHNDPEVLTTFMIVSGAAARHEKITEPTYVVDVPVTGLVHLGLEIDPKWQLDGRPVGIKASSTLPQPQNPE